MDAHVDWRGLLLGYDCIGVWRYLEKRRQSEVHVFFVQYFFTTLKIDKMKKKKLLVMMFLVTGMYVMTSCGSGTTKQAVVKSRIDTQKNLEGEKVAVETTQLQGIAKVDDLSEDGLTIVKVAYKWYAGIGKANDKQTAIEIAEREARATISRVVQIGRAHV